ncbi:MAG: hypothetical protein SGJ24_13780 [Chloroflexota bacterium]|nr:hypothetical protein [Chloroflexota bacterium]
MISADGLAGFLRLGFFVGGCGLVMLLMQPPGSPEFVLSGCSALMGAVLIGGVVIVVRLARGKELP